MLGCSRSLWSCRAQVLTWSLTTIIHQNLSLVISTRSMLTKQLFFSRVAQIVMRSREQSLLLFFLLIRVSFFSPNWKCTFGVHYCCPHCLTFRCDKQAQTQCFAWKCSQDLKPQQKVFICCCFVSFSSSFFFFKFNPNEGQTACGAPRGIV